MGFRVAGAHFPEGRADDADGAIQVVRRHLPCLVGPFHQPREGGNVGQLSHLAIRPAFLDGGPLAKDLLQGPRPARGGVRPGGEEDDIIRPCLGDGGEDGLVGAAHGAEQDATHTADAADIAGAADSTARHQARSRMAWIRALRSCFFLLAGQPMKP